MIREIQVPGAGYGVLVQGKTKKGSVSSGTSVKGWPVKPVKPVRPVKDKRKRG